MPQTDDMLEKVGQAQYICTLDLTKGYWKILIPLADRDSIWDPMGVVAIQADAFQPPQVAASFQRLMDKLLTAHQD